MFKDRTLSEKRALVCIFNDFKNRLLNFDFKNLEHDELRTLMLKLASLTIYVNEAYDKLYDERMRFIIHLIDVYTPEDVNNDDLPF